MRNGVFWMWLPRYTRAGQLQQKIFLQSALYSGVISWIHQGTDFFLKKHLNFQIWIFDAQEAKTLKALRKKERFLGEKGGSWVGGVAQHYIYVYMYVYI